MKPRAFFLSIVSLLVMGLGLGACGSTTSSGPDPSGSDGGAGRTDSGSAADAASDASSSDGGACVTAPNAGEACKPGDVPCDHVDPCCAQTVTCDNATRQWKNAGIACLLCNSFACGPQTCQGGTVCLAHGAGIPMPDGGDGTRYECAPMPAACARDWSCGCVSQHLPAGCTTSPSGGCTELGVHVTVSCMGA